MNYFDFHISDFVTGTLHLTPVEQAFYIRSLLLYYDKEAPLPADLDRLCRLLRATDEQERTAVQQVMGEFYDLEDGVYRNHRCDEEITAFLRASEKKAKAGRASGRARRKMAKALEDMPEPEQTMNTCSTEDEQNVDFVELPSTQYPVPNNVPDGTLVSPETQAPQDGLTVMVIPTISFETKGETFAITDTMINEWQDTYPLMAVEQELKRAVQWSRDNPGKRKTLKGMKRYLGAWLSRKHDKGYSNEDNRRQPNSGGKLSGAERTRRARDEQRRREAEGLNNGPQ